MYVFFFIVYFVITSLIPAWVDKKYLSDFNVELDVERTAQYLIIFIYAVLIADILVLSSFIHGLLALIVLPLHFAAIWVFLFERDRVFRLTSKLMS